MEADSDESYRLRLEGRAEKLAVARVRLVALKQMLTAVRWRARLRDNTGMIRETAADQPAVEEALKVLARRSKAESWPATSSVVRCAAEVEALCGQVSTLALRRLGAQAQSESLAQRLERLEWVVLAGGRLGLPGQRWKTAQLLFQLSHPQVQQAAQFVQLLETLFKRPMQPSARLPFTSAELEQLRVAWPAGHQALSGAWARVARIDAGGTLAQFLRRRARSTPLHAPKNGAEVILAAEFWRSFALARLKELIGARVAPVSCADEEVFEVIRWLVQREGDPEARLAASERVGEARAGLFELAAELSALPAQPASIAAEGWWRRLHARAERGQRAVGAPDFQKVQDNLRLFLRVLQQPDKTPPAYRVLATLPHRPAVDGSELSSLVELVAAMREKLQR
jgi:hypothetical protein